MPYNNINKNLDLNLGPDKNNFFYITKLDSAKDLPLPKYMTEFASGMDLYANISGKIKIPAGKIKLIPTGIKIIIPKDYEAQVRPRSGLALNHGISILNSPGTIDSDYRGEIKLILINLGEKDFIISRGDRIAQLIINKIYRPEFKFINNQDFDLDINLKTNRSQNGFGSTGI